MPHYFFNLRNGHTRDDTEGVHLGSMGAARLEAIQRLGGFMRDSPGEFDQGHDWRIEVTDVSGLMLFRLNLELLLVTSPSAKDV